METWKRAQGLSVATLAEGATVGRLEDFLFDLDDGRIYGWRIKGPGVFGKVAGVAAAELVLLGRDLAFIKAESGLEYATGKVGALDGKAWASAYRNTSAISRRGQPAGAVEDYVLAPDGQRVKGLLLKGGRLLPLEGRVHTGPGAVIFEDLDVLVDLGEDDDKTDWWARLKGALAKTPAEEETTELPREER